MQEQRLRKDDQPGGQLDRRGNRTQLSGCPRARETRKGKLKKKLQRKSIDFSNLKYYNITRARLYAFQKEKKIIVVCRKTLLLHAHE